MKTSIFYRMVIVLTVFGLLLPCVVYAEVFKWVDEQGNVHYTDKPPEEKKSEAKLMDVNAGSRTKSMQGTTLVKTKEPLRAKGEKNKGIKLESVVLDLGSGDGNDAIIGKTYFGSDCKPAGEIRAQQGRIFIKVDEFSKVFNNLLRHLGYSVIDEGGALFAGQRTRAAELSLAGIIIGMQVNGCTESGGGRVMYTARSANLNKVDAKYASYLKIKWKLFDNLSRKVIFEATTEGSDSRRFESKANPMQGSINLSFKSALKNLFAKNDFTGMLVGEAIAVASSGSGYIPMLKLSVSYDRGADKFVDVAEKLKAATATIRSPSGHGSGFFITSNGYLLTNAHVVEGADRVMAVFGNKELEAKVVRVDEARDVALIQTRDQIKIEPVSLCSKRASSGESVYVIGTPMDEMLSHSVTRGIISSYREMNDKQRYYQTDAAINPGNSGGPAFNEHGEVLGIAVAGMFTASGGQTSINFLIPIDSAMEALRIESPSSLE